MEISTDTPYQAGGQFPPTSVLPDIVIHDRLTNELLIFELTVPLEINILNAHIRKAEKYSFQTSQAQM